MWNDIEHMRYYYDLLSGLEMEDDFGKRQRFIYIQEGFFAVILLSKRIFELES